MKTLLVGCAVLGFSVIGSAPAYAAQELPVFVYQDLENGRVGVGAGTPAHPIVHAGADVDDHLVCFGLSYQTTQCVIL